MNWQMFLPEGAEPDQKAVDQMQMCMRGERVIAGALMADHHLGYSMPIGGVIQYDNAISPSGVGFDIGCGNLAVRTGIRGEHIAEGVGLIMQEIQNVVSFGMGRSMETKVDHELFDDPVWLEIDGVFWPNLKDKARAQLGTVGSGNHYVDLLVDDEGWVWVANHFGSRGFGHTIATGFLNLAAGLAVDAKGKEREEPTVLTLDSYLGELYYRCMVLAGQYAQAGREIVMDQVLGILGSRAASAQEIVSNHHNFAWRTADDSVIVRKGATPLWDTPAYIGGSMGEGAAIVRGTGEDIGALGSAPHGAGRVMSRTKAAGKWKRIVDANGRKQRVRDESTAAFNYNDELRKLAARGIVVLGGGADETPGVYKSLKDVLAAHENIEILHWLDPIGVVMAGDDVYDPYKD